jgi:hypothetical protein
LVLTIVGISSFLLVFGFILLWIGWPVIVDSGDVDAALAKAAETILRGGSTSGKTIFVSVDGRDPSPEFLAKLRAVAGGVSLSGSSRIPESENGCRPSSMMMGEDDEPLCKEMRLDLQHAAAPLWRTEIISASTGACAFNMTLIRPLTVWWVLSEDSFCV